MSASAALIARRAALAGLPSVAGALKNLPAVKALGQHFLTDPHITDAIVYHHGLAPQAHVTEIGPGAGILTRSILYEDVARLTVIEKDSRAVSLLRSGLLPFVGEDVLDVREEDAVTADDALFGSDLIANLPYNIGTEVVMRHLLPGGPVRKMSVMLQKEAAERFTARPGGKSYGTASIYAGLFGRSEIVMMLPPSAFTPPPKVDSAVLKITLREAPAAPVPDLSALKKVVSAAFSVRRKTLRNALKSIAPVPEIMLEKAGIAPGLRAEEVPPAGFAALAVAWKEGL